MMNRTINILDGLLILFSAAVVLFIVKIIIGQDPGVAIDAFVFSASGLVGVFFATGKEAK